MDELQQKLRASHVEVSRTTSCLWIKRRGYARKVIEAGAREATLAQMNLYTEEINAHYKNGCSVHSFVFIDEASKDSRDCIRRRGWALLGHRCAVAIPFRCGDRVSLCVALSSVGIEHYSYTAGTYDAYKFMREFTRLCQNEGIYPGDKSVLILDGARMHKRAECVAIARKYQKRCTFLSPYSPFFNSLENHFAEVKRILARHGADEGVEEVLCAKLNPDKTRSFVRLLAHHGHPANEFVPLKMQMNR